MVSREGSIEEWSNYIEIIQLFCYSLRMEASMDKYDLLHNEIQVETLSQVSILFSYQLDCLEKGLKYLGYLLKLNY